MKRRGWVLGAAIALVVVVRHRPHQDACALAQTWTAGDVHQYEILALSSDHGGHWEVGSYGDIEPDEQDFSWAADGSTMTFETDDAHRSVRYALDRIGDRCRLSLDAYPLPRSNERTWYTGGL